MRSLLILLIATAFATSCSSVKSSVSSFSKIKEVKGKKVKVITSTKEQNNSLEFDSYKNIVSEALKPLNASLVENVKEADWILTIQYGNLGSHTESYNIPIVGQTGGGTTYHQGTINTNSTYSNSLNSYSNSSYSGTSYTPAQYGTVGMVSGTQVMHTKYLVLNIFKNFQEGDDPKKNLDKLFESKVVSVGTEENFSTVSKCMFKTLFEEFPGEAKNDYSSRYYFCD